MSLSGGPVAGGTEPASQRSILILVILATAMTSLEVGLVTVALPSIARDFDAGPVAVQWVALSYQLAIIGTLILFGRLVDMLGGRAVYLAGMATMLTAAVMAILSFHILWLIAARGLLGIGAAMLLATGQALISDAYGEEGRGRALGFMHMAVAAGLMSGPALGGLLVTVIEWRAIFVAPIPVAAVALLWGLNALPRVRRREGGTFDFAGAVLIFAAASTGVLGLSLLAGDALNVWSAMLLSLSLLTLGLFVFVERNHPEPLLDLALLRNWQLTAGLLAAFLTFIALASNMFLIPFALQDLMGQSAARAGLIMMVVPLLILPTAPLAGAIADRRGVQLPATAGLIAIILSIFAMSRFDAGSGVVTAVAALMLYGIGAGLFQAPNNSSVLGAAPGDRAGIASGMLALSRNLGQVMGIAVASTVWTVRQTHYEGTTGWSDARILGAALGDAFLVLALTGCLALIVSLLRGGWRLRLHAEQGRHPRE